MLLCYYDDSYTEYTTSAHAIYLLAIILLVNRVGLPSSYDTLVADSSMSALSRPLLLCLRVPCLLENNQHYIEVVLGNHFG